MAATLQLDIVSPEAAVFSGAVTMVEVPGAEGDIGVLPNHAPLISTLREGVVQVHTESGVKRFTLSAGYAEVTAEGCTILSEDVREAA